MPDPAKWYETVHRAVADSGLSLKHVLLFAGLSYVLYKFLALWRGK